MAKWFGKVGYVELVETSPGVWTEVVTERDYYGDFVRNTRRLQSTDNLNDDFTISNEISIVADPYATDHFYQIRYAELSGVKWKVSNVEVLHPRVRLTLGGLYNGQKS